MTNTLHAHVSTQSRDCDGLYNRDYVMTFNDEETAESGKVYNDFSDIHFMNRVMCTVASPYAVEHGMRVTVDNDGINVYEDTEEGYRAADVRWCRENCDTDEYSQRDYTAEAMGY